MSSIGRHVRLAAPDDLPRLIELDHVAAAGDSERVRLIGSAVDGGHCLVLSADLGVVGYVTSTPRGFFGRDFVELLMVDSPHRRTGVGRALLRAAVGRAGTSRVFTSTNHSNRAMRELLEAEGWSHSGWLEGLDDDDPELVYFCDT